MTELKLIVAGGRDFNNYEQLSRAIHKFEQTQFIDAQISIVSGMARGADALGVRFAKENNVVLYEFPADWEKYGKAAGFKRNTEMAMFSHALIAFWDGKSSGTRHMIRTMKQHGKFVQVISY